MLRPVKTLLRYFQPHRAGTIKSISDTSSDTQVEPLPYGLKELHTPKNAIVDIVFVHSATGDAYATWTGETAKSPWPKELLPHTLLPMGSNPARIFSFGYDPDIVDYKSILSINRVHKHATTMLRTLTARRREDDSIRRPLFFVAHGLGGLVCEDALLQSKNSTDINLQQLLESTQGIAFLGTPHTASDLAKWAQGLAILNGLIKEVTRDNMRVFQRDSKVLCLVESEFHNMRSFRAQNGIRPIEISCFFEKLPSPGVGLIVSKESAILNDSPYSGIPATHMSMTKFSSKQDPGFIAVSGVLSRWIVAISSLNDMSHPWPVKDAPPKNLRRFV